MSVCVLVHFANEKRQEGKAEEVILKLNLHSHIFSTKAKQSYLLISTSMVKVNAAINCHHCLFFVFFLCSKLARKNG